MKRKVMIIGIGAGNPDFITIQAINALNQVDVFFIPDKGTEKADLSRVRRLIIDRYVRDRPFRRLSIRSPPDVERATITKERYRNGTQISAKLLVG